MNQLSKRLRERTVRVHDLSGVSYNHDEDCVAAADLIDTQDRKIEELVKALEQIEQDVTQTAFGAKPTRGAEIARTTLSTIQAAKDGT